MSKTGMTKTQDFIKAVIENLPEGWLSMTTHRLDIFNEALAKTEFLDHFVKLYESNVATHSALAELPTAYDYIRLGHPLSCVLEWGIANMHDLKPGNVICFSSRTIGLLAVLRKNLLDNRRTKICYASELPESFDPEILRAVYGYEFEMHKVSGADDVTNFDGSTVLVMEKENLDQVILNSNVDFYVNTNMHLGSIVIVNDHTDKSFIPAIQHVRRRETIAMTPANCLVALKNLAGAFSIEAKSEVASEQQIVLDSIMEITDTKSKPLVGSCGLSIQYAIMMGLIDYAKEVHGGKAIKFIVPTNCYGGTNDQARRVAACIAEVEVVDLLVDSGKDMVQSIDSVLEKIALEDAIPYIIAEIPTNPRVEVPDLENLKIVLGKQRKTSSGEPAIDPVFILDQTFCPNVHFLGEGAMLYTVRSISYASGSKFPSGGKCTAGYCVVNDRAASLMQKIELHLRLCDNEATDLQLEILAKQLPSMTKRIAAAYSNTREFVSHISDTLPAAKINFVSEELAAIGFTPSVFSLDLPTQGDTPEEREAYKRKLNHKLIKLMISEIPTESKYCVSYGQLKGCYWTIPATSTQGTTKEGDKDYIARVALSPEMDLEKHKQVFDDFVRGL